MRLLVPTKKGPITDRCGGVSTVTCSELGIEDDCAGDFVPDLNPETVNAAAVCCLPVNHGQDKVVPRLAVDLSKSL